MRLVINSPDSLAKVVGQIKKQYSDHKYLRVTVTTGKDRTGAQNALLHAWFNELAVNVGEYTMMEYKAECKLRFFVPILRAEDPEFAKAYDAAIKPLTYEQKILAMELMPVTSRCTTTQLTRGMEAMQKHYAERPTDSWFLEFPPEDGQ